MGLTRSRLHKRRVSGGKMSVHQKKKKYELGRLPANTRLLADKRVRTVRVRGGNVKLRALRLNDGNFSWGSETTTRRAKILDVVYNATSNELIRTKTLVKNAIVSIDAAPFRDWYQKYYGIQLGKKKVEGSKEEAKPSKSVLSRLARHCRQRRVDRIFEHQFKQGRLLAKITSRPGQVGRADGQLLEGAELVFYQKKMEKKKTKK